VKGDDVRAYKRDVRMRAERFVCAYEVMDDVREVCDVCVMCVMCVMCVCVLCGFVEFLLRASE